MIVTGTPALSQQTAFQGMAALALDVGFFTSEFRLCDKIAEYLADLVAHAHEDPARYGNLCTSLINEIIELVFRSVDGGGKIEFNLARGSDSVRLRVGFRGRRERLLLAMTTDGSRGPALLDDGPAGDLMALAHAVSVNLDTEIDDDDRITLIADFVLSEGFR